MDPCNKLLIDTLGSRIIGCEADLLCGELVGGILTSRWGECADSRANLKCILGVLARGEAVLSRDFRLRNGDIRTTGYVFTLF